MNECVSSILWMVGITTVYIFLLQSYPSLMVIAGAGIGGYYSAKRKNAQEFQRIRAQQSLAQTQAQQSFPQTQIQSAAMQTQLQTITFSNDTNNPNTIAKPNFCHQCGTMLRISDTTCPKCGTLKN